MKLLLYKGNIPTIEGFHRLLKSFVSFKIDYDRVLCADEDQSAVYQEIVKSGAKVIGIWDYCREHKNTYLTKCEYCNGN